MNNDNLQLDFLIKGILEELSAPLNKAGFYYRVFSRSKSSHSIKKKLTAKKDIYTPEGKKLQDIIGIRFVFYFAEDVEIFANYLRNRQEFIDESNSTTDLKNASKTHQGDKLLNNLCDIVFMPNRLNLVFKMNNRQTKDLHNNLSGHNQEFDTQLIDNTYEIQLRTVLSEGWHEVEHDLRYKCRNAQWWDDCSEESRMLNGIYASLETNERALEHLFSKMAHKNYKKGDWQAMLRNHFRIKFIEESLSEEMHSFLTQNPSLAKFLLKYDKAELSQHLFKANGSYPLTMDNIIHLINEIGGDKKNKDLSSKIPEILKNIISDRFLD